MFEGVDLMEFLRLVHGENGTSKKFRTLMYALQA